MIEASFKSIELFGNVSLPTSCGKSINFIESLISATLQLDIAHRSASADLPTDVISATLLIPDMDGVVWSVTSRTTTEYLVRKMVDVSSHESSLITASSAPEELKKAFIGKGLQDLRYGSDDGFYRRIILGSEIIRFSFKYTVMHFDVAFFNEAPVIGDPKIAIHVRENSLLEGGESLPDFYYFVDWLGFFRSNTAVYSEDYQCWQDNPFPTPLIFKKTEKTAKANKDVKVS